MGSLPAHSIARIVTVVYAVALTAVISFVKPGCVTVDVWASVEKSDQLGEIARRYQGTGPTEDLRCVTINVSRVASGEAEDALSRAPAAGGAGLPDAWSPAASSWLALLDRHRASAGRAAILPTAAPSVVQSPLVIAMPQPMAIALGWPSADISWKDIFALARDPQGWTARGHQEWGQFKLAKTNPRISTSGLHALVATYLMSGASSIDDPAAVSFMKSVERAVVHYSSTVSSFLVNLADADNGGETQALSYVSAIAMEEKQVWDYNQGNPEFKPRPTRLPPNVKLVAIYPGEGTF